MARRRYRNPINCRAYALNADAVGLDNRAKFKKWLLKHNYECVECWHCGRDIWKRMGQNKQYCSDYCRKAAWRERKQAGEVTPRKVGYWERTVARVTRHKCAVCGVQLDTRRKTYCSHVCRQKAYRERHKEPEEPREEQKTVIPENRLKVCQNCGGKIRVVRTVTDSSRCVKRMRECESCRQQTSTVEIQEDRYQDLINSAHRAKQIAEQLRAYFVKYNQDVIEMLKERDFLSA